MSREWKPGDVAIRSYHDREQVSIFVECHDRDHDHAARHHWHHASGGFDPAGDQYGPTYRPLVVIDLPKGALAGWHVLVNALREAGEKTGYRMIFDGLIEQIQAQMAPPKPPEPTGLGAVVEDAAGERWVRHEPDLGRRDRLHAWYPAAFVHDRKRITYDAIAAVRVLSEGVTE